MKSLATITVRLRCPDEVKVSEITRLLRPFEAVQVLDDRLSDRDLEFTLDFRCADTAVSVLLNKGYDADILLPEEKKRT